MVYELKFVLARCHAGVDRGGPIFCGKKREPTSGLLVRRSSRGARVHSNRGGLEVKAAEGGRAHVRGKPLEGVSGF